MRNVIFHWVLPAVRQLGGALPVDEIQYVEIELSADGGTNYSPVGGPFAPDVLEAPVNDLPFSDQYVVRGRVTDTDDQTGSWITVPFEVADNSPPGALEISVELV
jgi:hypothetical protein